MTTSSAQSNAPIPDAPAATSSRGRDRYFAKDQQLSDLRGRTVRGGAVTFIGQGAKFILQTGSTMILARLLTPADFGLVAMVTAATGFVAMFKDAGLSTATIQRSEITHEQVSTLFWVNVALSLFLMAALMAASPLVAWFYGEPRLTAITIAIAATFVLGGLSVQHQALLRRQMRFTNLAVSEWLSLAVSVAVAIVMALLGYGYWSLVGMAAAKALAYCLFVWISSGWLPGRPVRGSGVRPMLAFGGSLSGVSFLNYATRHVDNIIIGFALGSGPLGIYSKAYSLLMLPIREVNAPFGAVMIPALSQLQDDAERYRRYYLKALGGLALLSMPVVALLFVLADEAVTVLLGDQWTEAASVFRWLAPAAFLGTINVAPRWLLVPRGQSRLLMRWAVFSAPITLVGFLIGVNWGIDGVAAALSITWCIPFLWYLWWACRDSPVSFGSVLRVLALPVGASTFAGASTMLVLMVVEDSSLIMRLAVGVTVFSGIYAACVFSSAAGRENLAMMPLLLKRRGKKAPPLP